MTKQYEKFLTTLDERAKSHFAQALRAIADDDFSHSDIKKLAGYNDLYRIRIGKRRIVFCRGKSGNSVIRIESRGDVYKSI